MHFIRRSLPQALLLENVQGLATIDKDADKSPLDAVLSEVNSMGYSSQVVHLDLAAFHAVVRKRTANADMQLTIDSAYVTLS
eukprot:967439-Amphidinium_carterae.2